MSAYTMMMLRESNACSDEALAGAKWLRASLELVNKRGFARARLTCDLHAHTS